MWLEWSLLNVALISVVVNVSFLREISAHFKMYANPTMHCNSDSISSKHYSHTQTLFDVNVSLGKV